MGSFIDHYSLRFETIRGDKMNTLGIILGVIMGINVIFAAATRNWAALCGWTVAMLEWTRRLTL